MKGNKTLVWFEYALLIAGGCALAYYASIVLAARHYQAMAREQLRNSVTRVPAVSTTVHSERRLSPPRLPIEGGLALVGRVEVPRLNFSAVVAEGENSHVLRVAVGHMPGTALPWQSGNVVLVAHRDTFFRGLGELKAGDLIRMSVPGAEYTYRVTFTDIVQPHETWVVNAAIGDTLTLITCYPFHYIGPAPQRFVVRARRLDVTS